MRVALEQGLAQVALPHLGAPGTLASYAATADEIDPSHLERAASALGWRIAFPRVEDGPLSFRICSRADLAAGFRGIAEPAVNASAARPDVVLVPLLAVDRSGNRLGQGGGHYDRTLAALRATGPVLAIGLAFDMQVIDHVPARHWDQRLDAVATPTAFHLSASAAKRNP